MMLSRLAKEWPEISGHSLRKYHETKCGAGGMPPQLIALLNGVSTGRDSYVKNYEDGSLTRFYVKIYDELRIHKTADEKTQTELTQLRKKIQELETQEPDPHLEAQVQGLTRDIEVLKNIMTELMTEILTEGPEETEHPPPEEIERRIDKLRKAMRKAIPKPPE